MSQAQGTNPNSPQAEDRLLERCDSYFFALAHTIDAFVWGAKQDFKLDYLNSQFTRFLGPLGLSKIGTQAWDWPEFFHPEDFPVAHEAIKSAVARGASFSVNCRLRDQAGEYAPYLVRGTAMFRHDESLYRWAGTVTRTDRPDPTVPTPEEVDDYITGLTEEQRFALSSLRPEVSESKLAMLTAERMVKRFKFLAEASADLGSSLDIHTILQNLARLTVPRMADWVGVMELLPGDVLVNLAHFHRDPGKFHLGPAAAIKYPPRVPATHGSYHVMKTGRAQLMPEVTEEILKKLCKNSDIADKLLELGTYSAIVAPMIARGRIIGTVSFGIGTSKRRFVESDVEFAQEIANRLALAIDHAKLYQESQKLNQAKDEFLAVLSHEMRTPLNVIVGHSDMLLSEKEWVSQDEMRSSVEAIWRNARSQLQIVDDLLNVSQMILGKLDLSLSRFSITELVRKSCESLSVIAEAKELALVVEVTNAPARITADHDRIQQVVMNLIMNAIKYTPKGGEVRVKVESASPNFVITVADNGIGIDPEFLPFVFDRFRQESSSLSRTYGGLGLGLSIVRNLVELHGGAVRVESAGRGAGSRFTVTLPIGPESVSEREQDVLKPTNLSALSAELNGVRVLLLEDDPDTRTLIRRFLERVGAQVVEAGSVPLAVRMYKICQPNVILSDIGLPDQDGISFIERIREIEKEEGRFTPAAALTAFTRPEDGQKALAAGFQIYITKPVSRASLLSQVARLVRNVNLA